MNTLNSTAQLVQYSETQLLWWQQFAFSMAQARQTPTLLLPSAAAGPKEPEPPGARDRKPPGLDGRWTSMLRMGQRAPIGKGSSGHMHKPQLAPASY